ncbi:MAG: hypothetical protein KC502_06365 [Myxococcales bacterium]|nr:hypothetical protein [Myxococcales bacterium]
MASMKVFRSTRSSRGQFASAVLSILCCSLTSCGPLGSASDPETCNILTDSGCPAGQTCVGIDEPLCTDAGDVTHGGACKTKENCAPNHLCLEGAKFVRTCQRRCDIRKPNSCKDIGKAENISELEQSACLWVTTAGTHNLGYCSAPQCSPASNKGCKDGQKCVGGVEPRCIDKTEKLTTVVDGKTVTFSPGEAKLGASCVASGHCVVGGICAAVSQDGKTSQTCVRACVIGTTENPATGTEKCDEAYICQALQYLSPKAQSPQTLPAGQGFCALEHCNLVSNEGCNSGDKCVANDPPTCASAGNTGLLQTCDQLIDCDAATTCVSGGKATLCVRKCDTSGKLTEFGCAAGDACYPLKDADGKPRPNHLGYCFKEQK